jgi:hypothetical protein
MLMMIRGDVGSVRLLLLLLLLLLLVVGWHYRRRQPVGDLMNGRRQGGHMNSQSRSRTWRAQFRAVEMEGEVAGAVEHVR